MKGKSICQHLKKGLGESLLNYVAFVSDTDGQTIENMLTENDRKKFESFDSKGNHQKAISAIDFMNAVIKREYTPEQGTIENFKAVFSRLGFCPLKFADSTNTSMK